MWSLGKRSLFSNLARLDNSGNEVYATSKTTLSKVDCIGEIELFYPINDAKNVALYEPRYEHHCALQDLSQCHRHQQRPFLLRWSCRNLFRTML